MISPTYLDNTPNYSHQDVGVSEDLPSSEKINELANRKINAKKIFTALGVNWWKPIFDGKYHPLGPMVFDEGLHKKHKEEGFYNSAHKAYQFAAEHLCEPLTIDFYLQLHKIACAHFQGKKNNTELKQKDIGKFRDASEYTCPESYFETSDLLKFNSNVDHEIIDEYLRANCKYSINKYGLENHIQYLKEIKAIKTLTAEQFTKLNEDLNAKIESFKSYIEFLKTTEEESLLPEVRVLDERFCLHYPFAISRKIHNEVLKLFHRFNEKISEVSADNSDEEHLKEKKLIAIADLFQRLEFLHPLQDGQGRTDLILLSKLSTENGFSPAILSDPYVSSYVPLNKWCEYLKNGILDWRKEASGLQ